MPLALKIVSELDERSQRRAADNAVRTFSDAGQRSGKAFGEAFQLDRALDERALDAAGRRLATSFAKHGKTSADEFSAALKNEADRTGLGVDAIGEALKTRLAGHGRKSGEAFTEQFTEQLSSVAPQVGNALSGVTSVVSKMGGDFSVAGLAAAGGVAAIGAAAIETTKHLYEIGERFDEVAKSVEIRTGKMGSDLEALTGSIDNVATRTASSIETIGDIGGRLSQSLGVSGQPLEDLTKQVADLDRMTGETLNIRDFGKVIRGFGMDGAQASQVLDDLYAASTRTGAPVNELVESLKNMGASARSLHMDMGQTAALIDVFDAAGLNADTSIRGLNKAISEAATKGLDLKTVLGDAITQIHQFLDTGDEQKAQQLAEKLFGTKGAQQFIDAIRQGKLTVDDLNKSMDNAGPKIEEMNDKTMRWADTWTIVKNRIEDALKPLAGPVFNFIQRGLRDVTELLPGAGPGPAPSGPSGPVPGTPPTLKGMMLPGGGKPGQSGPGPLFPGLPVPMPVPSGIPAPAGPAPDVLGALDAKPGRGGGAAHHLPEAPEVPFDPGYGAPARVGETEQQYSAEQRVLEERHGVEEARARVIQLEHDNNATADDIVKARNAVIKAQESEQAAELALYDQQNKSLTKHVDSMETLGAKLDDDFGISKGLSGIADNLTKFLGNLMMAGPLSALQHVIDASGVKLGAPGAGGLIGMGAVSGMFGPGFVPSGGAGGAGGYAPGGAAGAGWPGGGGGMPGGAGIAAAAARVLRNTGQVPLEAMPASAAGIIASMFPQIKDIGGTRMPGTAAPGTHEIGRTLDVMMPGGSTPGSTTPSDLQLGNQIYGWLAQHSSEMGISSMIWQDQGHNFLGGRSGAPGSSWSGQSGHMNHIDVQFMPPSYQPPGGGAAPLQGPGVTPGPDMSTDASGGVLSQPPSSASGRGLGDFPAPGPGRGGPTLGPGIDIGPAPGAVGGPGADTTHLGGVAAPTGYGGGLPGGTAPGQATALGGVGSPAGAGAGMAAPMGGAAAGAAAGAASFGIGLAAQIAMQEAQRAIQYGGAVAGIATEGLLSTFLPTGGSQLAQNSWLTRIAGGLAGARPQIPNAAGKSTTQAAGSQPLPAGGGGGAGGGGDTTHNNVHNGDVNINAPSSDPNAIAKALAQQQQTMNSGAGPAGPGAR